MSEDSSKNVNPFDPDIAQPLDPQSPPSQDPTAVTASAEDSPTTAVPPTPPAPQEPTAVNPAPSDGWTTVDPRADASASNKEGWPSAVPPPPPPVSPAAQSPFGIGNQQPPAWPTGQAPGVVAKPTVSNRALAVIILAVTSYLLCPVIPAIAALVMAGGADREIEESRGQLTGSSLVTGGRILAWINIALVVIGGAVIFGLLLWGLSVGIEESVVEPDPSRLGV